MIVKYNPIYFKLVPIKEFEKRDGIQMIGGPIVDLEHAGLPFGFFSRHILGSGERNWAILKFDYYEKNPGRLYKNTRKKALDTAVEYLKNKGFRAIPFDLESLVDGIN